MSRFILICICLFATPALWARTLMPKDSIKAEKINGKVVVFHKVEPKETLFSLARRYKSTVAAIQEMNPEESKSMAVGTIIKVPTKATELKTPVAAIKPKPELEKKEAPKVQVKETAKETTAPKAETYTVAQGDNLFSIARKFNTTVAEIKKLNPDVVSGVKIGQVIKLGGKSGQLPSANTTKTEEKQEPTAEVEIENFIEANEKKDLSPTGYEKVVEKGLCEVIEDKDSRLHVALSKTAPEGTVIQIKNEINGRAILVKVIGKLPDTGPNDKVVVKISYKAFEAIGANAKRFPVVVSYTK